MSNQPGTPLRAVSAGFQEKPGHGVYWVGPTDILAHYPDDRSLAELEGQKGPFSYTQVTLQDIAGAFTSQTPISAVYSPLFWRGGDAIETGRLLDRHAFTGPYRIVTPPLPRPDVVLRELRIACPSLDILLLPTHQV